MNTFDEDTPRASEIYRTIQDFRAEFREAMKVMVRRDVYEAEKLTMNLRHDNMEAKVRGLEAEIEADRAERRTLRNLAIGVGIPGALSFLALIVEWVKG